MALQIIDTKVKENFTLSNGTKTWTFTSPYLFTPRTLRGLRQCVLQAEKDKKRIRATGSQHAYSTVGNAHGDYLVTLSEAHPYNPDKHNATVDLIDQSPVDLLRDEFVAKRDYYINVPGGLKIWMLNEILCPLKANQKARFGLKRMYNMGGGDVQAFAGALSTGTHGSGGLLSAYHDMVRSILVVASGGRLLRVEPANGITNPARHNAFYKNMGPDDKIELIQDDDLFYSLTVSMGCMGIIYSVILEVKDMDKLHEDVYFRPQGWGSDKLRASVIEKANRLKNGEEIFYSLYVNPYPIDGKDICSCNEKMITLADKNAAISKNKKHRNVWPSFMSKLDPAAAVVQNLSNSNAKPAVGLLESALKLIEDNSDIPQGGYTDLAYKVWNTGAGELKTLGTGIEFAFPYTPDNLFNIMKQTLKAMKSFAERGNKFYLNSPIAIRFAHSSNVHMAINNRYFKGEEYDLWFYLEFTGISSALEPDKVRAAELYQFLQGYLFQEDLTKGKVAGRPHWGLNFGFPFGKEFLHKMYPMFDKWLEAYQFFNPNGVFDGKFTDDLRLREDDGGTGDGPPAIV
jgi:hypothetical protein